MEIIIQSPHILVYHDNEIAARDKNGWCVDLGGSTYRFNTLEMLLLWLGQQQNFLDAYMNPRPD